MSSERTVTYKEAYDCKRVQPCALGSDECNGEPGSSHGIGSARYIFTVSGNNRAVELVVNTGHYRAETLISFNQESRHLLAEREMAELWFHYPENRYEWVTGPTNIDCEHTGGDCYLDSGSLWGQAVWDDTIGQADNTQEVLFTELEKIWSEMLDEENE